MQQAFARPLRDCDVLMAGMDELHETFLAGSDHSEDHLLYFVIEGQCWGISQGFQQSVGPGDLFVAGAGHGAWIQLTGGFCKSVWFHLADTEHWQALRRDPVNVHRASDPSGISSVMNLLLRDQATEFADRDSVASRYCAILITYLQREIEDLGAPTVRHARQRLHKLREIMNERLSESWTVERMAACLSMSAGHLHLLSKKHSAQTPLAMLRQLRMERARALLQNTNLTLDYIAAQVGYRTAYAFSDAFQRYTGKRPGAYRRG